MERGRSIVKGAQPTLTLALPWREGVRGRGKIFDF
jgi:hypothetical protein